MLSSAQTSSAAEDSGGGEGDDGDDDFVYLCVRMRAQVNFRSRCVRYFLFILDGRMQSHSENK